MLCLKDSVIIVVVLLCLVAVLNTMTDYQVTSAARLDQVTTSTVSTSLSSLEQIFNGPFTVLATTGTNLPCELWAVNFNATPGQYLFGSFNSDIPVSFFVVQQSSYQKWVKAETCGNIGDAVAGQLLTTSYLLRAVAIPSAGTWTIVIVNSSNARNADGYLAAYLSTVPYTVTQPIIGTITMTTTLTTETVVISQPVTGVPGFPASSIILGIIAGLIAVVMLRRRSHRI